MNRARAGLRATIVDRLPHDLRKMAPACGSEMARTESDLMEILHDYQTDLMPTTRLLHDLRKMAPAHGSEMVRAESDLAEILHDYQTDLMVVDAQTVAGEPFQGGRNHDSVAIAVTYQEEIILIETTT